MINKLYSYLFGKPKFKHNEVLTFYHNHIVGKIYFDWNNGLWFIELKDCDNVAISESVIKYYKNKNL